MIDERQLESDIYRLKDQTTLKKLFIDLNYNNSDEPVNKENWREEQKNKIKNSRIVAKLGDFRIFYIENSNASIKELKNIASKIISKYDGMALVCTQKESEKNNWIFSSLSKIFSKNFNESRHFEIQIKSSQGVSKSIIYFFKKVNVKNENSIQILKKYSEAFDEFSLQIHDELTVNVFEALKILSEGIVFEKANKIELSNEALEKIREPIFILLYRIMFVLYAEDRGIFPTENEIYREKFSIKLISHEWLELDVQKKLKEYEVQNRLKDLFRLIELGSDDFGFKQDELSMISHYGRLFDRKIHSELEKWKIPNKQLLEAISFLTQTKDKQGNYFFLDYSALKTRHLGSIYEHLLEFHLSVKSKKITDLPDPEERKTSGSYYTPQYIVDYIVHNSIGFKIDKIIKNSKSEDQAVEEILSLNILDPAMGSGHFLIGAVNYISRRICEIEDTNFTEEHLNNRKRDVVRRCIYGVDVNQLAVDLAMVSLWLETLSFDKPLSFLSAHLKCGNAVMGSQIDTLFNKQTTILESQKGREQFKKTIKDFIMLENLEDDSASAIKTKIEKYSKIQSKGSIYYNLKSLLDCSVAGFFGLKIPVIADFKAKIGENSLDFFSDDVWPKIKELSRLDKFFHWDLEFPDIFYDQNGDRFDNPGFDFLIGNPPYFQLQKNKKLSEKLATLGFDTFSKSADIYCIFYEKGISILKDEGVLSYMTSNSWMKTKYGLLLRKYLKQKTNPLSLIVFENSQLFDAAIVESCVFTIEKKEFKNKLKAINFSLNVRDYKEIEEYFNKNHVILNELDDNGWIISDQITSSLRTKLKKDSTPIKELNLKIYIGILNGFNEAFIIDTKIKNKLVKEQPESIEIIKPVLRGRDVGKYYINWKNLWMINSHNGISGKIDRIDIPKNYPVIYKYLSQFDAKIKTRANKGTHWTNLRNCVYFEEFEKPKIIWGELSDKPKFTFDDEGYFVEATLFAMIGDDLKYLLGILNSKLGLWYFEQIATSSGMGTNRWKKYKIEQFPIKNAKKTEMDEISNKVNEILTITKDKNYLFDSSKQIQVSNLENNVDKLVYNLYGLTPNEIKLIENSES